MKYFACLILFALLLHGEVHTQDIHFSQYGFAPLTLNPAMTAPWKDIQATMQQKQQWRSVKAFSTSAMTFEIKLSKISTGKTSPMNASFGKSIRRGIAFGINLFADRAGDGNLKTNNALFSIAYHTQLGEKSLLSAGISAAFVQRSIILDQLRWNSQFTSGGYNAALSSNEEFANQSFTYGDFGAGILWSYGRADKYMTANDQRHFHVGFSVVHLNRPEQSFLGYSDRLNMRYTFHSAALVGIANSNLAVGPSLLYMQQGNLKELTLGSQFRYLLKESSKITGNVKGSSVSIGFYYRNKDAVIPTLAYEFDYYTVGISYDVNISKLTSVTNGNGGIEISLRFSAPSSFGSRDKSMI